MFNIKVVDMDVMNARKLKSSKLDTLIKSYDFSCRLSNFWIFGQIGRTFLELNSGLVNELYGSGLQQNSCRILNELSIDIRWVVIRFSNQKIW